MKRLKENKGITLVALIITIIVLLILAVVAISAVQGDGIIAHAKNARDSYQTAQSTENSILSDYQTKLDNANSKEKVVGKTLNKDCVQTSEIQTLLAISNDFVENNNLKYKLVYKNINNEEIIISVFAGTTFENAVLSLAYKNNDYRIASENVKTFNLQYNNGSSAIYDKANVWTIKNGTITGNYEMGSQCTVPHYTEVTEFSVFEGTWQIDESQSTALGIQYLSGVLIDN